MHEEGSPIRNSVKAVVFDNGKVLFIEKEDTSGPYFILPGGGQEKYEPMHETLRRECREEVGIDVVIHELLFVRDYIARNHEFASTSIFFHQVELMFLCSAANPEAVKIGHTPDEGQIGVRWIPVEELDRHRVYPKAFVNAMKRYEEGLHRVYMGDIN